MTASGLREVQSVEVTVVVDNVLDILSTVPEHVTPQIPNLIAAGMREIGGSCLCCGAWGLSLLITTHGDGGSHTVLFDAGPEGWPLERNAKRLGLDLGKVESVVLSHGHFDHAGGLTTALSIIEKASGARVPMHVNPGMFVKRASKLPNGTILPLADVPSTDALTEAGGNVVSSDEARTILDDTFYISAEIPRVTAYETGLPSQVKQTADGGWEPDPLVLDERFLAVQVAGKGLVVFSSCSHAGVVNVMKNARELFPDIPLYAVLGGLHLSGPANEQWIDDTVRDIVELAPTYVVPCHCTGYRATHALRTALGDGVVIPGAVGQTHHF